MGETSVDGADTLVRIYSFAGGQHGPGAFPAVQRSGQQLSSSNDYSWFMRSLLLAMNRWGTDDSAPPESNYPRISDGDLVPPSSWPSHGCRLWASRPIRTRPTGWTTVPSSPRGALSRWSLQGQHKRSHHGPAGRFRRQRDGQAQDAGSPECASGSWVPPYSTLSNLRFRTLPVVSSNPSTRPRSSRVNW